MSKRNLTYFSLAFVWFSVHFGGGFASGRQPVDFFIRHHWTAVFMPAVAMATTGLTLYFGWVLAVKYNTYDYASWAKRIYYPFEKIMSPIHSVVLNVTMILATAVAFATSGSTLEAMLGTNFLLNTVVIGLVIFLLTIFGADLVRKVATVISIFMMICLLGVYVPNIIAFFPKIMANLKTIHDATSAASSDTSVWEALWWGLKYGGLQGCAIGAYIVHAKACPDTKDLKKAAFVGFLLNAGILYLAYFGIISFYDEGSLTQVVPSLFVVQKGIGGQIMPIVLSITLIVASVSTGVSLIFGVANRLVILFGRNMNEAQKAENNRKHSILASLLLLIVCWGVAQFGLIPLVATGFGAVGWMALIVICLPVILRGVGLWKAEASDAYSMAAAKAER
ncbi:hypothetical protein GO013_02085 [Pseudodesulfovibrio sp. JC047]|uniref:YkvI family membrane protein n=1 Tax=Pseudodesulfovibrio sp. JC047 TaxID=2683199 RepID=UPI0013D42524|nr:hypothetical protein [Pseudodesulfovibrio sp. JC047]NDV18207.1 hypothetical protein [Pseudodesulfovibrio sp. JC047]